MILESIVILHGNGAEISLLEYLFRVVLYLAAFGCLAAVVLWGRELSARFKGVVGLNGGRNEKKSKRH